jgi:uncharacterized protein
LIAVATAHIRSARFWSSALATLLFGSWPSFGQPSFDCAKATLPAERLICANPELSGLDEILGRSYAVAVDKLGAASACLRIDQTRWLRSVRNACPDDTCLRQASRLRLGELNPFQPGATFVKDVPPGAALVAVVPPGANIRTVDAPENPDPKLMAAEGRLEQEGGGYVLTTASRVQFVVQNYYFDEAVIRQLSDILAAPGERKRFRISGYRAAMPGQNVFEPRRCILIHRLPG